MPVDLPTSGRPGARSARLPVAFSASTKSARLLQIPTPKNSFDVDNAGFRMHHFEEKLFKEMTGLYELSKSKLAAAPPPSRPVFVKAYQHLRPLDTSMIDLRGPLSKTGPGLVVLELFSGIMATTEALVRCGVKVRKVYACEIESKTREVAQHRLTTLFTIRPEQLSREAIHGAHSHLPQDIRLITRHHIEQMEKPDLVVAGFPCQGFSMASDTPKGLRDPRTALFQKALRVIHLIWRIHGPCGYLFENLDASDHPVAEIRREYCDVVQAVLGKTLSLTRLLWVHMPTEIGAGGPTWSQVAYWTRWWTASSNAGHQVSGFRTSLNQGDNPRSPNMLRRLNATSLTCRASPYERFPLSSPMLAHGPIGQASRAWWFRH
jgi:hypothetical protein